MLRSRSRDEPSLAASSCLLGSPLWSLAEMVRALHAMRGIDLISAVTVLAEIGDLSRFRNPRELMGYLGLVPSESSTGDKVKRGGITKTGNHRARRILVEARARNCLESPNEAVWAVPIVGAQRQAADGGRHGHCASYRASSGRSIAKS
jgi:hypothetical protein